MNAAARALAQSYSISNIRPLVYNKMSVILMIVGFFLLANALAVIYVKDLNRRLFGELEQQQHTTQSLQVEWGQLLLERSTLTAPARVQSIATRQLKMSFPTEQRVVVVPAQ